MMAERAAMHRATGGARRRIALACIALIAFIISLLVAEGTLRIAGRAPPPGVFTVTAREYARSPGIFAPNQVVLDRPGTRFAQTLHINSLGYRGREFERAKPTGEFRIVFAGDSFTWGHNVADGETTPAQLETALASSCGRVTVVNAGLSGTSITGQDSLVLRALELAPDLVVLMYHENDIDDLMYSPVWQQLSENRRRKSQFPLSLIYPVVRTSALWNLALDVRRKLTSPHVPQSAETRLDAAAVTEEVVAARAAYSAQLASLARQLGERGLPFLFVTFPHPASVRDGAGARDYEWMVAEAARLAIPTVDLLPVLRASRLGPEGAYLIPDDYHPSAAGHALAARTIADRVLAMRAADAPAGSCRLATAPVAE